MRKRGEQINFSVSRAGKILYGSGLGELANCAYCHEEIEGEPKKVGFLDFHWHCYVKFFNWQGKNVQM